MKVSGHRVLICDCEGTMPLDGRDVATALGAETPPFVHTQLCRSQIERVSGAAAASAEADEPLLICCTQEAHLFREMAAEAVPDRDVDLGFVNIRETAGWSHEAAQATAKVAALIAAAAVPVDPTPTVPLRSDGVAVVYGRGDVAFKAARRLVGRLNVTCLLTGADSVMPPPVLDVPVFRGRIRAARGHLGAFQVTVDQFATCAPSSRAGFLWSEGQDGATSEADLIVDLSGDPPLFPAHETRYGYLRAEPSDPVAVERALFDATALVGEFDKPRFLRVDPALCAHSRNQIVGCTACLEVCPTGAITPQGDHAAVDAFVCGGHGACASVCPTGAIVFDVPRGDALFERLRVLTRTYGQAGGQRMVLLGHDSRGGLDTLSALARHGPGLPAHVVPFAVNEITQVGLDLLLTALAYGVAQVRLLAGPEHRHSLDPMRRHSAVVEALMAGLGYGGDRVVIDDEQDPDTLAQRLRTPPPRKTARPARHAAIGGDKRTTLTLALDHLHLEAPTPADVVNLPDGAPFGTVQLNGDRCTLCLACVGACPTGALGDDPERPRLSFTEIACVQCGLCRNTCPENAITLAPRINFAPAARQAVVLKDEEPFPCIRCGKPFASRSIISRLMERMAGHAMFAQAGRLDLIQMCEDCRIKAQFEQDAPFARGERPLTRTTDDDLRDRAARMAQADRLPPRGGGRP